MVPEWLPRMSQETTKEKVTICLTYFHTGLRRTELLLLLHPRAPSLWQCLFSYHLSFPGENSTGELWEETQVHHSFLEHHSCFQPCPQPPLSGCINGKQSATLSQPLAVSLSAEPAVTLVTSHVFSFASVLCSHLCSHPSDFSPSFLHRLIDCVVRHKGSTIASKQVFL